MVTEGLTPQEIGFLRVRDNLELFAGTCLRIKDKGGTMRPFLFNDAQRFVHERLEKQLRETGKVRALGASNFNAARLGAALTAAEQQGATPFSVLQNEYNLIARQAYGPELQHLCTARGIPMLPFFGLASGFLTGK